MATIPHASSAAAAWTLARTREARKNFLTMQRIAAALNVHTSTIGEDLKGFSHSGKTSRSKGGRPKGSGAYTPTLVDLVITVAVIAAARSAPDRTARVRRATKAASIAISCSRDHAPIEPSPGCGGAFLSCWYSSDLSRDSGAAILRARRRSSSRVQTLLA